MSITDENKKIALGFFEALLTKDDDRARQLLGDDYEFFFAGDLPMSGRHPAAAGMAIWRMVTAAVSGSVTFRFGAVTAEDDRVAVEAESFGEAAGTRFNNQYHFLFRIRAGKITQVKEYFDTLHVWELAKGLLGGAGRAERRSNLDQVTHTIEVVAAASGPTASE